jgi:hypothetical protein
MVTIENWEEYAILRADGELDAAGLEALENFLAAHPEPAEEAQLYDSIRLAPDEAVVFTGKENLLKPEPRIIALDRRWMWAAAAGLALLIGATVLLRNDGGSNGSSVATIASKMKLNTLPTPVAALQQPAPVVEAPDEPIATATRQARAAIARQSSPKASSTPAPSVTPQQHQEAPEIAPIDPVTPLSSADSRLLAVGVSEPGAVTDASPAPATIAGPKEEGSNLLARLAPGSDRLQLVNDLRATASERLATLRATRKKLRNTDVTVSVGRRDLFTIHF